MQSVEEVERWVILLLTFHKKTPSEMRFLKSEIYNWVLFLIIVNEKYFRSNSFGIKRNIIYISVFFKSKLIF